ncbi:hypothetical protein RND81_10G120100 [Saponaria officinalis]|uniref:S-protein homolog n=1 Tax=Saponaria officinalis TaxID=3572 RepID=A0AAW1I2F7_SAPOF
MINPLNNNHGLMIAFILIIFTSLFYSSQAGLQEDAFVRVINDLSNGKSLQVHCASKDDDLGIHKLAQNGEYYEFKFGPSLLRNTLFHCDLIWDNKTHSFVIYDQNRDAAQCWDQCYWKIKESGPCRLNSKTNNYDVCYNGYT